MQNYIIYLNRLDRLSPIGSCHPNRVAVAKPYTTRNATSNKFKRILPRVNAAASGTEAYSGTPLYNYDFSTNDGYYTKNIGSLVGIGTMVGSAAAYNDADKSMVFTSSNEDASKSNYLKLPSDTFAGITEGFSIGMWVKTTAAQISLVLLLPPMASPNGARSVSTATMA